MPSSCFPLRRPRARPVANPSSPSNRSAETTTPCPVTACPSYPSVPKASAAGPPTPPSPVTPEPRSGPGTPPAPPDPCATDPSPGTSSSQLTAPPPPPGTPLLFDGEVRWLRRRRRRQRHQSNAESDAALSLRRLPPNRAPIRIYFDDEGVQSENNSDGESLPPTIPFEALFDTGTSKPPTVQRTAAGAATVGTVVYNTPQRGQPPPVRPPRKGEGDRLPPEAWAALRRRSDAIDAVPSAHALRQSPMSSQNQSASGSLRLVLSSLVSAPASRRATELPPAPVSSPGGSSSELLAPVSAPGTPAPDLAPAPEPRAASDLAATAPGPVSILSGTALPPLPLRSGDVLPESDPNAEAQLETDAARQSLANWRLAGAHQPPQVPSRSQLSHRRPRVAGEVVEEDEVQPVEDVDDIDFDSAAIARPAAPPTEIALALDVEEDCDCLGDTGICDMHLGPDSFGGGGFASEAATAPALVYAEGVDALSQPRADPHVPPISLELAPAPDLSPVDTVSAPLTPAPLTYGTVDMPSAEGVMSSCSASLQSWGENNSRSFRPRRRMPRRKISAIGRQVCLEEDQLRTIIDAANEGVRSFDRQIYEEGERGFRYVQAREEVPSRWALSGGNGWTLGEKAVGAWDAEDCGAYARSAPVCAGFGGSGTGDPLMSLRRRANEVDCMGPAPGAVEAGAIACDVGDEYENDDPFNTEDCGDGFDIVCD